MPCRYQIEFLGPLLHVNRGFVTVDKWCQNFNLTAGRPSLEKQPLNFFFVIYFMFSAKIDQHDDLKDQSNKEFSSTPS